LVEFSGCGGHSHTVTSVFSNSLLATIAITAITGVFVLLMLRKKPKSRIEYFLNEI